MRPFKRAAALISVSAVLAMGGATTASAAPTRIDPGDYVNCPIYRTDSGRMVVDWQCFINTITYN